MKQKQKTVLQIFYYLFTAIIIYAAYATFFYITQRQILFPSDYAKIPFGVAEKIPDSLKFWINTEFESVETWYFSPPKSEYDKTYPLMIIAHGNADLIDRWIKIAEILNSKGIAVLLVEYPGYGRSTGDPSQESISRVFIDAYDIITKRSEIDKDKILLLGQSIGSGAVCSLAQERPVAAMILISAFTNIGVFAKNYFLPKFLVKDPFDNYSVISNINMPVLFIHGIDDDLISFEESEKLLAASKNGKLIGIEGGHNLRLGCISFWEKHVIPFLKKNDVIRF